MFREMELNGTYHEMGCQHGESLREEIAQTLDYYLSIFAQGRDDIIRQGCAFEAIIERFSPDLGCEIRAIAVAAKQPTALIFALNARSEILNNSALSPNVSECTSLYFQEEGQLAQNWDWSQQLESLLVLMRLKFPDGHRICQLTEPGIIGKIGMNSRGLGVCLNILKVEQRLRGLPVHVLLRRVLESRTFAEAKQVMGEQGLGKASHILLGGTQGQCFSVEFAGDSFYELLPEDQRVIHTNHYLHPEARGLDAFPSTHERLKKARELAGREKSKNLLLDRSMAELSINRPYTQSLSPGFGKVGTVFTVLMELEKGSMQIRPGSSAEFTEVLV